MGEVPRGVAALLRGTAGLGAACRVSRPAGPRVAQRSAPGPRLLSRSRAAAGEGGPAYERPSFVIPTVVLLSAGETMGPQSSPGRLIPTPPYPYSWELEGMRFKLLVLRVQSHVFITVLLLS